MGNRHRFHFDSTRYLAYVFAFYLAIAPAYVYASYSAVAGGGWFGGLGNVAKNGAGVAADYLIRIGQGTTPIVKRVASSSLEIGQTAMKRVFIPGALGAAAVIALLEGIGWIIDTTNKRIYKPGPGGGFCGYPVNSPPPTGGNAYLANCGATPVAAAQAILKIQAMQLYNLSDSQVTVTDCSIAQQSGNITYVGCNVARPGASSRPNVAVYPHPTTEIELGPGELGDILINNDKSVPEMLTPTATDTPAGATRAYGEAATAAGAPATTTEPATDKPPACVRNSSAPAAGSATATCSQDVSEATNPNQCGLGQAMINGACTPTANDPNAVPKPFELPAACTWLKFFCDFFSDEAPNNNNTNLDIPVPAPIESPSISFGGACPATRHVNISFAMINTTIDFDFKPICDVATFIRPVIISVAAFSAALIVGGIRVNEE